MTIEFKADRYFLGLWFSQSPLGSLLAVTYHDSDEDWKTRLRVRLYMDEKTIMEGSDDLIAWRELVPKQEGLSQENLRRDMDKYFRKMCADLAMPEPEFVPIYDDGVAWFKRAARTGTFPSFMSARVQKLFPGRALVRGAERDVNVQADVENGDVKSLSVFLQDGGDEVTLELDPADFLRLQDYAEELL